MLTHIFDGQEKSMNTVQSWSKKFALLGGAVLAFSWQISALALDDEITYNSHVAKIINDLIGYPKIFPICKGL